MLIMLLGSTIAGLALSRTTLIPKWLAVLLALMLPLGIGIGAINLGWISWPIAGITAIISGYLIMQKQSQPPRLYENGRSFMNFSMAVMFAGLFVFGLAAWRQKPMPRGNGLPALAGFWWPFIVIGPMFISK